MFKKSTFIKSWGFVRVPNAPLFLSTLLYLDVDKSTEDVRPAGLWCMSNIVESCIDCMEDHYKSKLNVKKVEFRQEEITLKQVDCLYHERNVKDFVTFCKKKNYPRGMIIFESEVDISFLINLQIPNVQRVVIIGRELHETAVLLLVKWIAKKPKVQLQFHDCAVDTFSGETIRKLKQVTSRLHDKIQIDRSSGGSWKKFNNNETYNFDTGQWETTQQSQQSDFTAYPPS
ncbi:hypothetical protein BSL78_19016 [Apostichopus japonicus]|uniref:Uncharacterized protein n=1 Tax=Stichopus japonicus TaxID=307972 RepID=A0A2G8K801_STIJA|nr:hypothetical protein BSL78_19016 [Apostichopus japonicus]